MLVGHRAIALLLPAVRIVDAREFGLLSPKYAQPLIYQEKCQECLRRGGEWERGRMGETAINSQFLSYFRFWIADFRLKLPI